MRTTIIFCASHTMWISLFFLLLFALGILCFKGKNWSQLFPTLYTSGLWFCWGLWELYLQKRGGFNIRIDLLVLVPLVLGLTLGFILQQITLLIITSKKHKDDQLLIKSHGESQSKPPGKYTKTSLTFFIITAVVVLLDLLGPIILSSGHDIISSRLHDQLAFIAFVSLLFIPILMGIGFILGIIGWRAEHKTLGSPSRMTVVVTCLNLISFLIAIILLAVGISLIGPYSGLPRWPG